MTQSSSGFTALNRAATVLTLLIGAGFISFGLVADLPWVVGIFALLAIAALAVAPWRAASPAPEAGDR